VHYMNTLTELKHKIKYIPQLPGIYKMLDAQGNTIYIGQSKCLQKRVRTYFTPTHKRNKVDKLVSFIADLDYQVTDTHLEAKLLECRLIKEIKPLFNSQLKNDGRYVYLKIEETYKPRQALTVTSQRSENSYGPFRQKYRLYEIIDALMTIFPITKKNDQYQLTYQPLPLSMDQTSFNDNKNILKELFSDTSCMDSFLATLENKMQQSAALYNYATAAKYRDIMRGLNYLHFRISDYNNFLSQDYLLKIPTTKGIKLFFVSKGQILAKKAIKNPTGVDLDAFISAGYTLKAAVSTAADEKAAVDYHDIIYSEIKSLPQEAVKQI
jgi:excinuclease ABC subunit C